MNGASWLREIVDWVSLPLMAVLAGILARRRLHREFPFFFTYLVATGVVGLVRLASLASSPRIYFYVYWISGLLLAIFNVLVVHELFVLRLFPRFFRVRVYRYGFAAVVAAIVLGSWIMAMESGDKYRALVIENRVFDFVIVTMLFFFVSLMLIMGREWTRYDFAIAFGFVIANVGDFIASAMWVRTHYKQSLVEEIAPLAFDVACLIWLYCFWSAEKPSRRTAPATLKPEMVQEARRWEAVLKAWIAPGKRTRGDTK